jgi:methyl-accepting chemotaxis protein PixJ
MLLSMGIGTAVAALLVSAVAAYLANRATRPILAATVAVEKLGQGELNTRIAVGGKDELAILGSNINQMAIQLQNLVSSQAIQTEQANFLSDIASAKDQESQELESVFNKSVRGARELLKADRVVVYRFNPDWTGYIGAESVLPGWQSALNDKIDDPCITKHLIEAYRKGRVVPTDNVMSAGFHPEHLKLMERLQIKANLVTPILKNNQLYGLLIAHHCAETHQWQQPEINFLTQLAALLGIILNRLSFLEQKQASAERASQIKDITLKLAQGIQAQNILDTAVAEIRQVIKSDRVVVYGFNDQWKGTVIAESVGSGFAKSLGAKIDDPCFADRYVKKYTQGRVQATENIYDAGLTDCHIAQLEQFAVKANLVAPIIRSGQLLGLLIAHQCDAPRIWLQEDIDMFSQVATQVGLALDRALLLEQQKNAKELLQRRALELLIEVDPISKGDLTIRANVTEDEIGTIADSYNATINSLRKIVTQVQTAAKQVTATTSSSEGAVQELSKEALRQTEEIKAALDQIQEMSDSIRAVTQSAQQAEAAVQQATQTVAAGDAAMNRTVDGMMAIRQNVAETSKKVKRLGESSQKISKVVNLIGTFADQTNLLALNASIEAAHAGEQGRGFAVVADEVRTLARQSAQATADIESLVKDIQQETNEVVAAMEAGTEQVVTGTVLVHETRQSLLKITEVSQQISELVGAIATATTAQSQASQMVSTTMTDVAAIANQTSNEATVVSASFKELLALAQELQASASQFKVS